MIKLDIPQIHEPQLDVHSNQTITALIEKSELQNCSFAQNLKKSHNALMLINDQYHEAIPKLKQNCVISHGDLDQKNVLWNKQDQPFLIDWESARLLNPTYEILNACLDWSGITTEYFNSEFFKLMMNKYITEGGKIDEGSLRPALFGIMGNWINWLVYNIKRSCDAEFAEQRTIGIEQVDQVLMTLMRLQNNIHQII